MDSKKELLPKLDSAVNSFIETYKTVDKTKLATDKWTAEDLLRHVTFWHENYVRTLQALAERRPPTLLKGKLLDLNMNGVESLKPYSSEQLIEKLTTAQHTISTIIATRPIRLFPYKEGGQIYPIRRFLYLVARHFHTHEQMLRKCRIKGETIHAQYKIE